MCMSGRAGRGGQPRRGRGGRGNIRRLAAQGKPGPSGEQYFETNALSPASTEVVPDSLWFCSDFRLAASLVIIQPSSGRVVLVHDTAKDYWFLPRGRKDAGESLEQTALREGYEESGFQATMLPLFLPSGAPVSPESRATDNRLRTEPFYIRAMGVPSVTDGSGQTVQRGEEYIVFFYVGQIPADAVRVEGTGMPDEQAYVGKLVTPQEAVQRLAYDPFLQQVVVVAIDYWKRTESRLQQEVSGQEIV